MASKRRGILYLITGLVAAGARFGDEAATMLARGSDEIIEAGSRSGDDVARGGDESGSVIDDAANKGKRVVRQHRIETALENQTVSETFEIPSGYYAGFSARANQRAELSYEFETVANETIDVLLLGPSEFKRYDDGGDIESSPLTDVLLDQTGSRTTELEPYSQRYLIFDNTAASLADADEQVTVTATVTFSLV
ncbi:hypothetical protein BV210_05030 [Halorientalis sp. IM1011]|uniref:hypothetical protein n=1 Tax=Halorientalis sp. IM1011 TaxID=1932360 RepID=UPI00097CC26C|nr:hypothetical protein [Halorientalis sp. IM1011]AQL42114.1 hypothetical protein BV210_05030 [Halorientalis sp. IM1011]